MILARIYVYHLHAIIEKTLNILKIYLIKLKILINDLIKIIKSIIAFFIIWINQFWKYECKLDQYIKNLFIAINKSFYFGIQHNL